MFTVWILKLSESPLAKMKHFTILVLAILAVCAFGEIARSHNVTWGNIGQADVLLNRETVEKKSKWLRIVSDDYVYPKKGSHNSNVITGIRVTDQYTNGKGGFASLLKGGPGFYNVTIHLKSKRSNGYKFVIDIYGRYF